MSKFDLPMDSRCVFGADPKLAKQAEEPESRLCDGCGADVPVVEMKFSFTQDADGELQYRLCSACFEQWAASEESR